MVDGDGMKLDGHMPLGGHMVFDERRESYDYIQLYLFQLNSKAYLPATFPLASSIKWKIGITKFRF